MSSAGPGESPGPTAPTAAGTSRPKAVQTWTGALVLLCLGALWLEFRHIDSTLPYPLHVDEGAVAGPAQVALVSGSFRPPNLNYPTLPTYLAAGGMAVGFLRAAGRMEIREVQQIGNVGHPYYQTRAVMRAARQLFALLSVIGLAATGVAAWLVLRRPVLIVLAPLILLTSVLFFDRSWAYLNVDMVGTCWVMLTMAACLQGTLRPSIGQSAVIPGVCAGLATASKYSMAVVILPVLLAIWFYVTPARRRPAWVAALAAMIVAFLVAVPHSVLDLPLFLNGVAYDLFHYASGHAGFNEEPGLPQFLFSVRHFALEFGAPAVALALAGVVACAAADWRRAAVLAVFPAVFLWLLSSQQVHFTRNALSLHPFVALFAAVGLVAVHGWLLRLTARLAWLPRIVESHRGLIAALILGLATVSVWHFVDHFRDRTDSRNRAQSWIEARVPRDWTIVIPAELGFDHRPLEADGRRVTVVELQSAGDAGALESVLSEVPTPAVILAPRWGADPRFDGQERANELNGLANRWRVIESFGTADVLVNYVDPVPFGNPAFAVAVIQ